MKSSAPSKRTIVQRGPQRAEYDRTVIYQILDEAFICHVGFVVDGEPVVIPMSYARMGDRLVIHGSQASRMMRSLEAGVSVCVSVVILDGLVLARSAFDHSMNYRSLVVFGHAHPLNDASEKREALRRFSEHICPGRWAEVRQPNDNELKTTMVLTLALDEASAKIRSGPPVDQKEDYDFPVWAGELPLRLVAAAPVADPQMPLPIPVPAYLLNYRRPAPPHEM
jgi:nitroimidazol reductase NimA-like FMN-containing flavoprotein (pyridoxamine 5'-phosphate oxidase superfamily)